MGETIRDLKIVNGTQLFLVKWKNYDESENTWEPINNLSHCNDVINDYLNTIKKASKKKIEKNKNKQEVKLNKDSNSPNITINASIGNSLKKNKLNVASIKRDSIEGHYIFGDRPKNLTLKN